MSAMEGIRKIGHQTVAELVYRDLCDLLMAGQAAPGERFTLRSLAEALGTSPMPVRDGAAARSAVVDDITASGDYVLAHGNLPD